MACIGMLLPVVLLQHCLHGKASSSTCDVLSGHKEDSPELNQAHWTESKPQKHTCAAHAHITHLPASIHRGLAQIVRDVHLRNGWSGHQTKASDAPRHFGPMLQQHTDHLLAVCRVSASLVGLR